MKLRCFSPYFYDFAALYLILKTILIQQYKIQLSDHNLLNKSTAVMDPIYYSSNHQEVKTQRQKKSATKKIVKNQTKKKSIRRRRKDQQRQRYRWTEQETEKYCYFIQEHQNTLLQKFKRNKQGIFNLMETYLNHSRTKLKCKSHHHKMMRKHRSIPAIVNHLRPDLLGKKKTMAQFMMDGDGKLVSEFSKLKINEQETPSEAQQNLSNQNNAYSNRLKGRSDERDSEQYENESMNDDDIGQYGMVFDSQIEINYEQSEV